MADIGIDFGEKKGHVITKANLALFDRFQRRRTALVVIYGYQFLLLAKQRQQYHVPLAVAQFIMGQRPEYYGKCK